MQEMSAIEFIDLVESVRLESHKNEYIDIERQQRSREDEFELNAYRSVKAVIAKMYKKD